MKTTIVIEDAGAPQATGAAPDVTTTTAVQPADAGAAPGADATTPGGGTANDGGVPPSWLLDGIAAAGGVKAPSSPEGIDLGGDDAGRAPSL